MDTYDTNPAVREFRNARRPGESTEYHTESALVQLRRRLIELDVSRQAYARMASRSSAHWMRGGAPDAAWHQTARQFVWSEFANVGNVLAG
jgi:hypothetical protein